MTEYRTGNHHGITIVAEGDGARCGRPDHDCARGHLVAVVVEGGGGLDSIELAERICALLNGAMRQCAALAALDQAATDMRAGYPGHGYPIEYVNGWEDADAFAEGFASGDAPRGPFNATESASQPSAEGSGGTEPAQVISGRFWGEHRAHPTCIDVTSHGKPPGSEWICGPECPRGDA